MDEEIRNLLNDAIRESITDLAELEAGTKERSSAVSDIEKLYRLSIEEAKNGWDYTEKYDRREMEKENHEEEIQIKEKQLDEQKKERHWKTAVTGIAIGTSFLMGVMTMAFEKAGNLAPRAFGEVLRDVKKFIGK